MQLKFERDLDLLRRATQAYAVLAAWAGSGALERLADGESRRLEELPGDPRALGRTAAILTHLGVLVRDGDRVALSRSARDLWASGALRLGGVEAALGDLSRLDPVLRDGGPARGPDGSSRVTEGGVRQEDPKAARQFMDMLFRRSDESAEEVGRFLGPRLVAGARVLDLGGGHGRYAHVLSQRGLELTLFDRAVCVELARERFGDTLRYVAGDFLVDELGGPFDAALLSNIVHGLGPAECATLFSRLHAALRPGALLVVKDMYLDEHGAHPAEAAFFDLTMLMYTREGQVYPLKELRALLSEAGFSLSEHLYVADAQFSLALARRD